MAKASAKSCVEEPNPIDTVSQECDAQIVVDTVYGDEALKVIAAVGSDNHWSAEEEAKLVKKIDLRLMPILCITFIVQNYDKAMLAQAVGLYSMILVELV